MEVVNALAADRAAAAQGLQPPTSSAASDSDCLPKDSASIEDEEEWVPYGADFLRHPLRHLEGAVVAW